MGLVFIDDDLTRGGNSEGVLPGGEALRGSNPLSDPSGSAPHYSRRTKRLASLFFRENAVSGCDDWEMRRLAGGLAMGVDSHESNVAIAGGSQPPECAWIPGFLPGLLVPGFSSAAEKNAASL